MRRWLCLCLAVGLACLLAAQQQAEPNSFRFVVIGDRTGRAQAGVYERVWAEADAWNPSLAISIGDSIEGGNDNRAAEEWRSLQSIWQRFARYPLHFVPGNHDVWSARSEQLYREATGKPLFYSFDHGGAHFTILDNSRSEELSNQQLSFLRRDLAAHRAQKPKIVLFHRPFWALYLKLGSGEFPLHQIVREHKVDYVISGHLHQLVQLQRDGVPYVALGSSGAGMERGLQRGEGRAQGWFYQHARCTVEGGRVQCAIKELGH